MDAKNKNLSDLMYIEKFSRSNKYDPMWVLENQMGLNALWLTEILTEMMELKPGMRILDMGCGRGISSIFLAKEFGVQVWATDLWIKATDNWRRVRSTGMENVVFPINAEAHSLPFAEEFFDAAISIDAFHYFGTDELYLGLYFAKLIKHYGQIGIVVPGIRHEFQDGIPEHLKPFWNWEFNTFHSPDWWRNHFDKSGKFNVIHSDFIQDGWQLWHKWHTIRQTIEFPYDGNEAAILEADQGNYLGLTRLLARRK